MQGSVYMQVYILAFLSEPHLDIAIDATARCFSSSLKRGEPYPTVYLQGSTAPGGE